MHRSFDLRLVAPLLRATLRMTKLRDLVNASLKAPPTCSQRFFGTSEFVPCYVFATK
jgi:hypothetical protein